MDSSLKQKVVLLTGTSSGIGKATAKLFQQRGWNVAATMRTPEKERDLNQLSNVTIYPLDVTDTDSIKSTIAKVLEQHGRIDCVVNNAGYGLVGPFEASTEEQVAEQFATNVFGLMNVTREILPHFRERRAGTIIQVASVGGRVTFPLYSVYHSTKWAVEGFSESLQHELRPFNIRVKIVEPGPIKTDFYSRSMQLMKKDSLHAYDAFVTRAMSRMNEAGEKGSPPEVTAEVICKAAEDTSWKLRYPAGGNAGALLTLRKLLPDSLFNGVVRKVVLR